MIAWLRSILSFFRGQQRSLSTTGTASRHENDDIIGGAEWPQEAGVMNITVDTFADTPVGTFSRLTAGTFSCYTVERPWVGNVQGISCIPGGTYPLRKRPSPVVQRTSAGIFREGWEVCEVPGRSLIMIHPGNTMDDVEGCISPGKDLGFVDGKWAVTSSRDTFEALMRAIPNGEHVITIRRR